MGREAIGGEPKPDTSVGVASGAGAFSDWPLARSFQRHPGRPKKTRLLVGDGVPARSS
jgi:hypothetical protein